MERIHVGPGHMASYITPIFICDTCDEAARKALKNAAFTKVFIFTAWLDGSPYRTGGTVDRTDRRKPWGRHTAKILKRYYIRKH